MNFFSFGRTIRLSHGNGRHLHLHIMLLRLFPVLFPLTGTLTSGVKATLRFPRLMGLGLGNLTDEGSTRLLPILSGR